MRYAKYLIVFTLGLAAFSFYQPWGAFSDPDAFYHAKMASLLLERGIIRDFPWLDLTSFNQPFANHHFLFHAALTPFVKLFGMYAGNQIAAVVFAAGFITLFYLLLRLLKIKSAEFWTLLLVITPPLVIRLSLGKASPLAIAFAVSGLVLLIIPRPVALSPGRLVVAPVVAGLVGFLFSLTHGGWPLLLFIQLAALLGFVLFDRIVARERGSTLKALLLTIAATIVGVAAGLAFHPYSSTLFSFLWVQIVKIAVATPVDRVIMGREWYPYEIGALVGDIAPLLLVALGVIYGLIFAPRPAVPQFCGTPLRSAFAVFLPTAALFILTLKSMRFAEYLVPLLVLFLALLAQLVDWKKIFAQVRHRWRGASAFIMFVFISAALFRGIYGSRLVLVENGRPFDQFAPAIAAISKIAKPDARIFNADWSSFPQLFALSDRYRYVSGLDPTFLLEVDPALSDAYTRLTLGAPQSAKEPDAYELIHDRLRAAAVFAEARNNQRLIEILREDGRFKIIYEDTDATVFEVR